VHNNGIHNATAGLQLLGAKSHLWSDMDLLGHPPGFQISCCWGTILKAM